MAVAEDVSELVHAILLLHGLDASPTAPKALLTSRSAWLRHLDCIDLSVLLPSRSSTTLKTIGLFFSVLLFPLFQETPSSGN